MASTTWRGRIAFGMVSIPVRLYKAARRERIRFHHVYRPEAAPEPEDIEAPEPEPPRRGPRLVVPEPEESAAVARVHSAPMASPVDRGEPAAPVAKERILKGFELEKDRYVVFEPSEIAAMKPRTSSELVIDEFVHLAEIDPVFFDTSYYVAPDEGGERPYAILYTALAEAGYAAMGTFAMHSREHAAVVRPGRRGLILHTLFYAKEVRADAEYAVDASLASPKERELAVTLVKALAAPFDPEKLKSGQEEKLRALIESRAARAVPAAGAEPVRAPTPPVDILEALRKSLAAARKPAASETRPPTAPARKSRKK